MNAQNVLKELNEKIFLDKMMDLLEVDELDMGTKLWDIDEWDSLSGITFMVMANDYSANAIEPQDLKDAVTIGDLYDLLRIKGD